MTNETDEADQRVVMAKERTALAHERTRLANERTFLAWIRTGLASVGGGLAIIRFVTFQNFVHQIASETAGATLVLLGIAIFVVSFFDYRNSSKKLKSSDGYAGSLGMICGISFVLIAISVALLLIAFKANPAL